MEGLFVTGYKSFIKAVKSSKRNEKPSFPWDPWPWLSVAQSLLVSCWQTQL